MDFVQGRVLDVGCGAGRGALELQRRGHEVVAIDVSPGAIEVCQRRGVKDARVLGIEDIGSELGIFDTILLLGVNLGLLQNVDRAKECLRRFTAVVTTEQGRAVAGGRDPNGTDDPVELGYQRRNRERGRLPAEHRLRVRYRNMATSWFEWLTVSKDELESIAASSDWSLTTFLDSDYPLYVAILGKQR